MCHVPVLSLQCGNMAALSVGVPTLFCKLCLCISSVSVQSYVNVNILHLLLWFTNVRDTDSRMRWIYVRYSEILFKTTPTSQSWHNCIFIRKLHFGLDINHQQTNKYTVFKQQVKDTTYRVLLCVLFCWILHLIIFISQWNCKLYMTDGSWMVMLKFSVPSLNWCYTNLSEGHHFLD